MSADLVPPPSPWWLVRVDAYRFLIRRDEVSEVLGSTAVAGVAHLPAWLAGLVHHRGRLFGVVDLGRFLGVCTVREGPLLIPGPEQAGLEACHWALRVHGVQAGPLLAQVNLQPEEWLAALDDDSMADPSLPATATRRALTERTRPDFAVKRWYWTSSEDGQSMMADELSLALLWRHPRFREQG